MIIVGYIDEDGYYTCAWGHHDYDYDYLRSIATCRTCGLEKYFEWSS